MFVRGFYIWFNYPSSFYLHSSFPPNTNLSQEAFLYITQLRSSPETLDSDQENSPQNIWTGKKTLNSRLFIKMNLFFGMFPWAAVRPVKRIFYIWNLVKLKHEKLSLKQKVKCEFPFFTAALTLALSSVRVSVWVPHHDSARSSQLDRCFCRCFCRRPWWFWLADQKCVVTRSIRNS